MRANQIKTVFVACFLLVTVILISCLSKKEVNTNSNPNMFGESFNHDSHIDVDSLMTLFASADEINDLKVKAKINAVCKAKGCWMNVSSANNPDKSVFVKFKDYGFFMPLDCAGKEVIMNGRAFKEVTSVDELKHYAEDEGLSQAEIDAIKIPKEEYKFMADGVLLLDEG